MNDGVIKTMALVVFARIADTEPMASAGDATPCRSVGAETRCPSQGPALDHVFRGREILDW